MAAQPHDIDPRRRRTREVLVSAFVVLAQQRRYDEIRIDDIVKSAGVSRSTFYEHFAGKHALLGASMADAMSFLARLPSGESGTHQAAALLAHFWDNRALARCLLHGTALRVVRKTLVSHVDACLARCDHDRLRLPRRLAAHAIADGILSPILAWLSGEAACDALVLADALKASSRATLAGMAADPIPPRTA